ncbi:branched-chain amino acid ABC transporter permease [Tenuibacillus multivorans]|uniref:Branched-chain amino acid transport system permease protein n=1 Tax=Tenuibacillus multivorans TaxID=237069 RepID=A0A1H0G2E1_9BACI|nr:branched-chain amino acid ABC transporter permease [Tenuibacillus multivorans]GEL78110.1 branched-chain amino acid ABC transporter permease [Tenuibacillus multivorans]SDO01004.1 branched-chain amino acid transport system permease protein [Tenuibacillus multivorans]
MDLFINLAINGIATGMLIFLIACGLTLIFGLMDVLNFAHGGIFAWGAFVGVWGYSVTQNFLISIVLAVIAGLLIGLITEYLIIRPVYGNHIQQILITLGFMLVLSEFIKVVFGPNILAAQKPPFLQDYWLVGDVTIIKYRAFTIVVGFIIFVAIMAVLKYTKIGLIVRAGVMDKEMIQALGVNIRLVFIGVFMVGSALAALGGALFAPSSGVAYAEMGMEFGIFAFIVVIIGGMGSVPGSLIAALLVGLSNVFMAYYVPSLAMAVTMILMFLVLIFRPEGLFKVSGVSNK